MKLVEAEVHDEDKAFAFVCELEQCQISHDAFHEVWVHNMNDASITYYFLMKGDATVGFCSLRILHHLHHGACIAQIEEFVVNDRQRREGCGTYMMEELKKIACRYHCILLELSSRDTRVDAHAFYRAQGMEMHHYKFTETLK